MPRPSSVANANWWSIAEVTVTAAIGIAAIAAGFQGWAWRKTTTVERTLFIVAGFALVYPTLIADLVGLALFIAAVAMQLLRREPRAAPS